MAIDARVLRDAIEGAGLELRSWPEIGVDRKGCVGYLARWSVLASVAAVMRTGTMLLDQDGSCELEAAFQTAKTEDIGIGVVVYFPDMPWPAEEAEEEEDAAVAGVEGVPNCPKCGEPFDRVTLHEETWIYCNIMGPNADGDIVVVETGDEELRGWGTAHWGCLSCGTTQDGAEGANLERVDDWSTTG